MFTGLIEEVGHVRRNFPSSGKISIFAKTVLDGMKEGGSIAVNGVCLTVTDFDQCSFTADVTPETLHRSTLNSLSSGRMVNLERPVAANSRFDGHFVSGHIDGIGQISSVSRDGNAVIITIETIPKLLGFIVEKGSVAVDGISLTVASVGNREFSLSIIPHTGISTTLVKKKSGDKVNIETDIIGKYVRKFLPAFSSSPSISAEFLSQNGF